MLCEGPDQCPFSSVICLACDFIWKPTDPKYVSRCPQCDHGYHEKIRCEEHSGRPGGECPITKLELSLDNSQDASALTEIKELENLIQFKVSVYPEDIRADVYPALVILNEERERYEKENPNKG